MSDQHDFIDGVRTFNLAAGRTEDRFDARAVALHTGLQLEELAEALEAMLKRVPPTMQLSYWQVTELAKALHGQSMLFKRGNYDGLVAGADRQDLLDACVDVMVVTVGSIMSQGADAHGACGEVNRANLAKLVDGKAIKDGNGKIQKPAGWTPPDLSKYVRYPENA